MFRYFDSVGRPVGCSSIVGPGWWPREIYVLPNRFFGSEIEQAISLYKTSSCERNEAVPEELVPRAVSRGVTPPMQHEAGSSDATGSNSDNENGAPISTAICLSTQLVKPGVPLDSAAMGESFHDADVIPHWNATFQNYDVVDKVASDLQRVGKEIQSPKHSSALPTLANMFWQTPPPNPLFSYTSRNRSLLHATDLINGVAAVIIEKLRITMWPKEHFPKGAIAP